MKTLKIIKIGGNIIDNKVELNSFLKDFAKIKSPKILVHGGGKLATDLARQMNIEVKMIEGRRVTDKDTLEIITMIYAGKISKGIIAELQARKCNAIGFSGADGNTIISVKRPVMKVDFGFVGDIERVNTKTINLLLDNSITPVFCAISHDANGQLLNTNADTIASELAIAFADIFKVELYYCFDKKGVLKDFNDDGSIIEKINSKNYQSLIDQGLIVDGMLPKLVNCFNAIKNNVKKVCVGRSEMLFNPDSKFTTIEI